MSLNAQNSLNHDALAEAVKAFMSVEKSFTIRNGVATGREQLEERLSRAITAYNTNANT